MEQRELLIRIDENVQNMDGKLDALSSRVDMIEKRLFIGNGQPSISEQVKEVRAICGGCKFPQIENKVFWLIAGFVGVVLLAVTLDHIPSILRILGGK